MVSTSLRPPPTCRDPPSSAPLCKCLEVLCVHPVAAPRIAAASELGEEHFALSVTTPGPQMRGGLRRSRRRRPRRPRCRRSNPIQSASRRWPGRGSRHSPGARPHAPPPHRAHARSRRWRSVLPALRLCALPLRTVRTPRETRRPVLSPTGSRPRSRSIVQLSPHRQPQPHGKSRFGRAIALPAQSGVDVFSGDPRPDLRLAETVPHLEADLRGIWWMPACRAPNDQLRVEILSPGGEVGMWVHPRTGSASRAAASSMLARSPRSG